MRLRRRASRCCGGRRRGKGSILTSIDIGAIVHSARNWHVTEDADEEAQGTKSTQGLALITKDEFIAAAFEAPIRDSNNVDCCTLADLYQTAAAKQKETGNESSARVFEFLAAVTNIHFKPNDRAEPYGPLFVMNGKRSIIPADLMGKQSDTLSELVPDVQNPGLQARLADIVWINDRALPSMAQLAVGAYCEAVQLVFDGKAEFFNGDQFASGVDGCDMLLRACQIARATGWKDPEASRLKELILTIVANVLNRDNSVHFERIGEICLQFGIGDSVEIARKAEAWALSNGMHPQLSRDLLKLAASAYRWSGDDQGSDRCLVASAECLVTMAETAGGRGMVAASRLTDAIAELRRLSNTRIRRRELETALLEAQSGIRDEMGKVSTEVDLTGLVTDARRRVAGMSLSQALGGFATLEKPPDPVSLHKVAQEQANESPLSSIMPHQIVDEEGKSIATSPGFSGDEEGGALTLRYIILRHEGIRRDLVAQGQIEPARQIIQMEHPLDQRDFFPIAEMSPFVPGSQANMFALGFARFFGGDFASALHILVPQLENSLRHVLKQYGIDPSVTHNDMTQENRSLSSLLDNEREALERIFGAAIVFEIDNLFNFRGGPALRNRVAHGLMSDDTCHSAEAVYACWFVFRLCCVPLFPHWREVSEELDRR